MTTGRKTVAPGQTIASEWGNLVWDQSTQNFASTADRDTQWPAPHDGAVCYTAAEKTWWVRTAGAWRALASDTGLAVHAPALRIRQTTDQAFGTGVATPLSWAADAAYPAGNATGFLTYATGVTVSKAGIVLAVLQGVGTGGRFEWAVMVSSKIYAAAVGATDNNAVSISVMEAVPAGATISARAFGYTSGTLAVDSANRRHGMTVTYLGTP